MTIVTSMSCVSYRRIFKTYNYLYGYSPSSLSKKYKIIPWSRFRFYLNIISEVGLLLKYFFLSLACHRVEIQLQAIVLNITSQNKDRNILIADRPR